MVVDQSYGWRQVAEVILDVAEAILSFHEIIGFLSLQLVLSFELGLRLRLNKNGLNIAPAQPVT